MTATATKELQRLPAFEAPSNLKGAAFSINQLGKNMTEHAYLIGEILIWVKSQLKHGELMDWIEENVWFKRSAAGNFMSFTRKCKEAGMMIEAPHYIERPKLPKFGNTEFDLIGIVDQEIRKATNGKMGISEEKVGLDVLAPLTFDEWESASEIISKLPVNPDRPISTLEGLTPFLIGDVLGFFHRIEKAREAYAELKEKNPAMARYITIDGKGECLAGKQLGKMLEFVNDKIDKQKRKVNHGQRQSG